MIIDVTPTIVKCSDYGDNQMFGEYTGKSFKTILDFYNNTHKYVFVWNIDNKPYSVYFTEEQLTSFLPKVKVSEFIESAREIRLKQRAELEEWLTVENRHEWYSQVEPRHFNFLYYHKKEREECIKDYLNNRYKVDTIGFYKITI